MNFINDLQNLLDLNKNNISLIDSDCFKQIDKTIKSNIISLFSYIEFNEPKNFLYKSIAVDSGISIEYTFDYGQLDFLYIDDSIELKVTFNERPKIIPSFNDYCYINVDEYFKFKSLTFQKYFPIASVGFNNKNYNNNKQGFCFCAFRYKMNSEKSITKDIVYVNLNFGLNVSLKKLGLLDVIFNFDISLDELFSDFLSSLSQDPQTFYSVFEEYPKQIDIVREPIFLKDLIEKAYLEYSQDIEQFNSKMLILKMGRI